jgi:hypothetical protein
MAKINSNEAFKLYQLTRFYPACVFSNVISIVIPGILLLVWINNTFTITVEKKVKNTVLTEKELLILLDKIQETK